jgi:hypothetical protein
MSDDFFDFFEDEEPIEPDFSLNEDGTVTILGVVYSADLKQLIKYHDYKDRTSYSIAEGVTSIAQYAFKNIDTLERVDIPLSVQVIEAYAFYNCNNLTIYPKIDSVPDDWDGKWKTGATKVKWSDK